MNKLEISRLARRIEGCYIPIPTLFGDGDLDLNLPGMKHHVRFLLDGGVCEGSRRFSWEGEPGNSIR
jgi:hypothetical protein